MELEKHKTQGGALIEAESGKLRNTTEALARADPGEIMTRLGKIEDQKQDVRALRIQMDLLKKKIEKERSEAAEKDPQPRVEMLGKDEDSGGVGMREKTGGSTPGGRSPAEREMRERAAIKLGQASSLETIGRWAGDLTIIIKDSAARIYAKEEGEWGWEDPMRSACIRDRSTLVITRGGVDLSMKAFSQEGGGSGANNGGNRGENRNGTPQQDRQTNNTKLHTRNNENRQGREGPTSKHEPVPRDGEHKREHGSPQKSNKENRGDRHEGDGSKHMLHSGLYLRRKHENSGG